MIAPVVLLLAAGPSDSFADLGYFYPKNLTEIGGRPLIQHVLESLRPLTDAGGDLVCALLADEDTRFFTSDALRLIIPDAWTCLVSGPTKGAACTALLAIERIEPERPLLIVNGDQVLNIDLAAVCAGFEARDLDAGTVVFDAVHPRWSFVRCDENGYVVEAAEKRPISRHATAGVYWFRYGRDFVDGAMQMIRNRAEVEGRYFVCPVFNDLILAGKTIGVHEIDSDLYHSLAQPRNVDDYEKWLASR